jgi:hypothetical protein
MSRTKNVRCIKTLTFDPLPFWERGENYAAGVPAMLSTMSASSGIR